MSGGIVVGPVIGRSTVGGGTSTLGVATGRITTGGNVGGPVGGMLFGCTLGVVAAVVMGEGTSILAGLRRFGIQGVVTVICLVGIG